MVSHSERFVRSDGLVMSHSEQTHEDKHECLRLSTEGYSSKTTLNWEVNNYFQESFFREKNKLWRLHMSRQCQSESVKITNAY